MFCCFKELLFKGRHFCTKGKKCLEKHFCKTKFCTEHNFCAKEKEKYIRHIYKLNKQKTLLTDNE